MLRALILYRCLAVLFAAITNPLVMISLLSSDGAVSSVKIWASLMIWNGFWVALAVHSFLGKSEKVRKIHEVVWVLTFVTFPAVELITRAMIAMKVSHFISPSLYFDVKTDPFWLFSSKNSKGTVQRDFDFDTQLGWIENDATKQPVPAIEKPILYFGDSFMVGVEGRNHSIPKYLSQKSSKKFTNFAGGGYGFDQIYLSYIQQASKYPNASIVISVLLDGIDRIALKYRGRAKPYFTLRNGKLVLHTSHLSKDPNQYLRNASLPLQSYIWEFAKRRFAGHLVPQVDFSGSRKIGRLLFEEIAAAAKKNGQQIRGLIFYESSRLEYVDWRETYLKEEFTRVGIKYFDTKPWLLKSAQTKPLLEIYSGAGGHLGQFGNELVASNLLNADPKFFGRQTASQ